MRPKKEPEGMNVFSVAAAVHRTSVPPSKHSGKGVNGDGGGAGSDPDRKVSCFSLLVHNSYYLYILYDIVVCRLFILTCISIYIYPYQPSVAT